MDGVLLAALGVEAVWSIGLGPAPWLARDGGRW
jgi:hypothetical protein